MCFNGGEMHFIRIKQEYLDYLQQKESRIPNQEYGEGRYKPFYILDQLDGGDVLYVTQVTSPKPRHKQLKNSLDFKKIYHPESGKYLGATNLNYMFPIMPEYIEHLSYKDLKQMVTYDYHVERLAMIRKALTKMNLKESCNKLMELKYEHPDSKTARRSLDFKQLETYMVEYKLREVFERDDITVERSIDHSTFLIQTDSQEYEYSEEILKDMYGFIYDMEENLENELELKSDELSL